MAQIRTTWLCLGLIIALSIESSAFDSANWMRNSMGWLGGRSLKQLCIPGSHNSGMNKLNGGTAFAKPCNILNQSRNIRQQLELGIRYFDIRPVIAGGKFKTGHYSKSPVGWQGGNGQSIDSIVNEINDFTNHHKELIIINLSHSLNTDVGNSKYRGFNEEEWNRLFQILDRTNYLFYAQGDIYLPALTLGYLTNNGNRATVIYVINDSYTGINLGGRLGRGYFYWNNIQTYDKYADSNKVSSMSNDQISKMKQLSQSRYFLLSWTLTQKPADATLCPVGKSTDKLAKEANREIHRILPEVSVFAYPNIIFVDFVETSVVAEVAMAINNKLAF